MNVMTDHDRQPHWQGVYTSKGEAEVSWFQESPAVSLEMVELAGVSPAAAIIDIGGGASRLVDALLDRGFQAVSALDLSAAALETAKARLGARGNQVEWIVADVTTWQPTRSTALARSRRVSLPDRRARPRGLCVMPDEGGKNRRACHHRHLRP